MFYFISVLKTTYTVLTKYHCHDNKKKEIKQALQDLNYQHNTQIFASLH